MITRKANKFFRGFEVVEKCPELQDLPASHFDYLLYSNNEEGNGELYEPSTINGPWLSVRRHLLETPLGDTSWRHLLDHN